MRILGIIAEYNPFHTGHLYHLNKAKKMIQPDYTVVVMSSSFVQRGEPAIVDKWVRSKIAVLNGADLVIELPLVCAVESADYFAHYAILLLHEMGVTDLVFGSETGEIEPFIEMASIIESHSAAYNKTVRQLMQEGNRYAEATNKALSQLMNKEVRAPNDLLALSYVKDIITHHYPMTPHVIKRTNDYHSEALTKVASATALRHALVKRKDVSQYLPGFALYQNRHYFTLNDFYDELRYNILFNDHLSECHLVDEGIENALFKAAMTCSNVNELISQLTSKRYTSARISRMLVHILLNNTKDQCQQAMHIDYIRALAFNDRGRQLIKMRKSETPFKIVTSINKYRHPALAIERKGARLLSLIDPEIDFLEYSSIPYIRQ